MFKKFLLVIVVFLSGCGAILNSGQGMVSATDYYKMKLAGKEYFFQYPKQAVIVDSQGYVDLSYILGCGRVYYGDYSTSKMVDIKAENAFKVSTKRDGNKSMEVWYLDNSPVFDLVSFTDSGVSFWLYSDKNDVTACMDSFNSIVDSFTSEPRYVNGKFGFSVRLPEHYKLMELPSGDGVILKKSLKTDDPKVPMYDVNITFIGMDNFKNYQNIADYVGEKYPGYTLRFKDFGKFSGFFVDESVNVTQMATSHFFTLGGGTSTIYEASIELPSKFYTKHGQGFEELVATLKFN